MNNPNLTKGFPEKYRIFDPIERLRIVGAATKRIIGSCVRVYEHPVPNHYSNHYTAPAASPAATDPNQLVLDYDKRPDAGLDG